MSPQGESLTGESDAVGARVPGDTIVAALRRRAAEQGGDPAMRHRGADGAWVVVTWADYAAAVGEVAAGLTSLGIGPGECVAVLASNRVEWHLADHGILGNGDVTVPVYPTSAPEQIAYILGHTKVRLAFVEDDEQLDKVRRIRSQVASLDHVVVFDPPAGAPADPGVITFDELRARGRAHLATDPSFVDDRAASITPDQLATLVFTSGTTGPPKGVMITHANIMWTLRSATRPFEIRSGERLLSFLPLSHIAERVMSDFLPIAVGGETWFARDLASVREDLLDCRPTVFFAVPRVWDKLHEAVVAKLAERPAPVRRAFAALEALGRRKVEHEQAGGRPDPVTGVVHGVLDRVVGAKVRHGLGLDQARVLITAAAPIHPDLLRWFHAIGMPLIELYGQSEDCGPTTANLPGRNKIGTVGPAIPGVTVRIADDGEILVKGGNVCAGYYRDPEATASLIDEDGWMHTGDLGTLDVDGYLTISGRKKDLIINAAGKNIAPQNIEVDLRNAPLIAQAVVIGEGRRYLTALITLDPDSAKAWAESRGKPADGEALAQDPDLLAEIQRAVDDVNAKRSRVEAIKKFRVLPGDFTLAGGELTPTLKPKRHVIAERHRHAIEALYADDAG